MPEIKARMFRRTGTEKTRGDDDFDGGIEIGGRRRRAQ